jgi:hypothetical protein
VTMSEAKQRAVEDAILNAAKSGNPESVMKNVDSISARTGAPRHIVARSIFALRDDGKLVLVDPGPPSGIPTYATSPYGAWLVLLMASVISAIVSIYILPAASPFIYMRYILGSLMVLFLPGYSLIEVLYPKKEDLEGLERLALSIGLSLALVPLVGLALNYTPWGIRLDPIVASLSILTFALGLAAAYRKLGYLRLVTYLRRERG